MKLASAAATALVFMTLAAATTHAQGMITGSVLRLDERTFRIRFEGCRLDPYPECGGDPPTEGAFLSCTPWTGAGVSGDFGLPSNSDCGVEEGQIRCYPRPFNCVSSQFDFEPTLPVPSRLTLRWDVYGDWVCEWCFPLCYGSGFVCGGFGAGGEVNVALPTRIGDSAPFEPVVAVRPSTWGMVKQLYR